MGCLIVCAIIALSMISMVDCDILIRPTDTISHEGDTVQLNCSSSFAHTVMWTLTRSGTTDRRTIFEPATDPNGVVLPSFRDRFNVVKKADGSQNLVIVNISYSDAGSYMCIDDQGFGLSIGQYASANLIVIGRQLDCTHNIDGDICEQSIEQDNIHMSCSINYRGNIEPTVQFNWTQDNTDDDVSKHDVTMSTVQGAMVTSTVVVQTSELMNGARFICTASVIWNKSMSNEWSHSAIAWTSPPYTSWNETKHISDIVCSTPYHVVTCAPGINPSIHQHCSHHWTDSTTNKTFPSQTLRIMNIDSWSGEFVCTVECRGENRSCTVQPLTVIFSSVCKDDFTGKSYSSRISYPSAITVPIIVLIVIAVVLMIAFNYLKRRHNVHGPVPHQLNFLRRRAKF